MSPLSLNFYAAARRLADRDPRLHEGPAGPRPPERLLQRIWQHQRLRRDQLRTSDGQPVRVLHPGFWSHEGGPDFRAAVLQIGAAAPRTGDVEIDVLPGGWHAHGHDRNPAFHDVLLHVVWDGGESAPSARATLALQPVLDAPLDELDRWLGGEGASELPGSLAGQCAAPLRDLPASVLADLLRQAAQIRLQTKASRLAARARQAGWEQALWEELFGALGYKHNFWAMHRVAELWPGAGAVEAPAAVATIQARLLGLSGLLPDEWPASAGRDRYLKSVWDQWWRERDRFHEFILPRSVWRLHGLRPANHPQRRLALAAHWLAAGDFVPRLERWLATAWSAEQLAPSLLAAVQVPDDDFWSWHWTLRSARRAQPQPLLGARRLTDLAVNVVLPWFWIRAVAGGRDAVRAEVEQRYFAWPAGEDNAVLRLARQRLLGGVGTKPFRTAAAQQGLLQIVRDFCSHSNAVCEQCRFPELVRGIGL